MTKKKQEEKVIDNKKSIEEKKADSSKLKKSNADEILDEVINEEKSESTGLTGFHILLILILILAILAFSFIKYQSYADSKATNENTYEFLKQKTLNGDESDINYVYDDYVFVYLDGSWETKVDKVVQTNNATGVLSEIPFYSHYGPKQVENVSLNLSDLGILTDDNSLKLSFNVEMGQYITMAGLEFSKIFVTFWDWPKDAFEYGLTTNVSEKFPQINCEDGTKKSTVVLFDLSNTTEIVRENNCIKVLGTNQDEILRASDKLMFTLMGISE